MTDSFTLAYIIFAIVLLHLILGFVWVIYKFSKKKKTGKTRMGETKTD
jgi:hypothetical protein